MRINNDQNNDTNNTKSNNSNIIITNKKEDVHLVFVFKHVFLVKKACQSISIYLNFFFLLILSLHIASSMHFIPDITNLKLCKFRLLTRELYMLYLNIKSK